MKVEPLRRYDAARYPTMDEVRGDPELLRRVPNRWLHPGRWAALVGCGLLADAALPAADGVTPPAAGGPATDQAPAGDRTQQPVDAAVAVHDAWVAPLLAEALAQDGRGAFGCVAVNPPSFLSEDEAMELIRKELEAVGLRLEEGLALPDVEMPVEDHENPIETSEGEDGSVTITRSTRQDKTRRRFVPTTCPFDFADAGKGVYIEFLTARDHHRWAGRSGSTAQSYHFPEVALTVTRSLQKRRSEKQAVFGVFFDPLAGVDDAVRVQGLTAEQSRLLMEESMRFEVQDRAGLQAKGMEKLRAQVRHFIAFLRDKGVVGKAGP